MKYLGNLNNFQTQSSEPISVMLTSTCGQRLIITENKNGEFNIKIE